MTISIEINHLSKHFGRLIAVDDISFQVQQGEVLGFLGPNGAGKSTTMKMITGFMTPDRGTARICGYDILQQPLAAKKCIGYLPEGAPAYPDMTPASFLDFIAEIRGFYGASKRARIAAVVDQVNLQPVLQQPIETLSKGYKRRVGLAQALLHNPPVLILDEPTDGLDPNQKYEVRSLIKAMAREKVIILSTHILEEVDAVCSRAIIIAKGRLLADGTPQMLEAKAQQHNAVRVSVKGPAQEIQAQLAGLAGVARLEVLSTQASAVQLRLYPQADTVLIPVVNQHIQARGWELQGLYTETGRLDDVFREITTTA